MIDYPGFGFGWHFVLLGGFCDVQNVYFDNDHDDDDNDKIMNCIYHVLYEFGLVLVLGCVVYHFIISITMTNNNRKK